VDEQIKELTKELMNVRLDLREISTKVDAIKDLTHSVTEIDKRVTTVEASVKSAHHRMDKIEKIHAWIAMTAIGGILAAVVTFIVKGGLVK
jgi:uncharacterized protein YoxC